MGRKLNLAHLSDDECRQILDVIQRDFRVRHHEKERITDLQKYVYEEAQKRMVLSRQQRFNEKHCICCFSSFGFILNRKVQCQVCRFFICKNCRAKSENKDDIVCIACVQQQELQVRACEWFYTQIRARFRRFGSAKVVRSLYKRDGERDGSDEDRSNNSDSGLEHQLSPPPFGTMAELTAFSNGDQTDQQTSTAAVSSLAILLNGTPEYDDWLNLLRPPMSSVGVQAPQDISGDYVMEDLLQSSSLGDASSGLHVNAVEDNMSGLDNSHGQIFSTTFSVAHIPTAPTKLENISSTSLVLNHPGLKSGAFDGFGLIQIEIPRGKPRRGSASDEERTPSSSAASSSDEVDGGGLHDEEKGVMVYSWGDIYVEGIASTEEGEA